VLFVCNSRLLLLMVLMHRQRLGSVRLWAVSGGSGATVPSTAGTVGLLCIRRTVYLNDGERCEKEGLYVGVCGVFGGSLVGGCCIVVGFCGVSCGAYSQIMGRR